MEKSENEPPTAEGSDGVSYNHWVWLHLSSQLIFYVLEHGCYSNVDIIFVDGTKIIYLASRQIKKDEEV